MGVPSVMELEGCRDRGGGEGECRQNPAYRRVGFSLFAVAIVLGVCDGMFRAVSLRRVANVC